MAHIFVSGSTGFVGVQAIQRLLDRGHSVTALARSESIRRVPTGARLVTGSPLDAATFTHQVAPADTFLHLTGVTKPAPWKERQFRAVDLVSLRESVKAATTAGVRQFIYISVAKPAPVMQAYIKVRQECEAFIAASKIPAAIIRPWYVLGPGRQWPLLLKPFYWAMELTGSDAARRLGLVTIHDMTAAIAWSVENPGEHILDVPRIRECAKALR